MESGAPGMPPGIILILAQARLREYKAELRMQHCYLRPREQY